MQNRVIFRTVATVRDLTTVTLHFVRIRRSHLTCSPNNVVFMVTT